MCKELDLYLDELERTQGRGAISSFARKIPISRVTLWRYRTGKQKPDEDIRKKIKRLTYNLVKPEHFTGAA